METSLFEPVTRIDSKGLPMRQRRLDRNLCLILPAGLLFVSAANSLFPTARSRIRDPGWLLREHLLTMNLSLEEMAAMLADEYATVKDAANRGMPLDQAVKTLRFAQYKDWHNYSRLQGEIKALYELIQTGKRSYLE